eukprot:317434_1
MATFPGAGLVAVHELVKDQVDHLLLDQVVDEEVAQEGNVRLELVLEHLLLLVNIAGQQWDAFAVHHILGLEDELAALELLLTVLHDGPANRLADAVASGPTVVHECDHELHVELHVRRIFGPDGLHVDGAHQVLDLLLGGLPDRQIQQLPLHVVVVLRGQSGQDAQDLVVQGALLGSGGLLLREHTLTAPGAGGLLLAVGLGDTIPDRGGELADIVDEAVAAAELVADLHHEAGA